MMLSRALILCLSLVVINRGAPNIPQSYLPPPAAPPAPECRVITEEQEQEVQEEECAVTEVETCDTGTIFLLNLPFRENFNDHTDLYIPTITTCSTF